ncbi:MAG: hypothetical protein KDB27_27665 [Planctomycetales bacterium]|nr:hypothetical protein [Planctomycetales bacterium]
MSQNNLDATQFFESSNAMIQPWVEYWVKLHEQNVEWSQALMSGMPPNADPAAIRNHWSSAMTQSIEAFMRTPAFLESMRRNAEALTAAKVTSELAKREVAREMGVPHSHDISGLYERLESAHEGVLERLSAIEARLTTIEEKLNPLRQIKEGSHD